MGFCASCKLWDVLLGDLCADCEQEEEAAFRSAIREAQDDAQTEYWRAVSEHYSPQD